MQISISSLRPWVVGTSIGDLCVSSSGVARLHSISISEFFNDDCIYSKMKNDKYIL